MKGQLFLILTILTSLKSFAQIDLEKGYFINNSDQKIECLIKNVDWFENPIEFKYKLSQESDYLNASIKNVKEFGVYNKSKYLRAVVDIDRSSNNVNNLSKTAAPSFNKEELFLKVIFEGNASLYEFIDDDITRYFYKIENSEIKQLVYKEYINKIQDSKNVGWDKEAISENNYYKQQLWNDLKCPKFTANKLKNLNYRKSDLINLFSEYSNCNNDKTIVHKKPETKKDNINLTLRPRLNNSSLNVQNSSQSNKNTDFGNKTGFGFGVEFEYLLPFNNHKWSFLIEPTYQNYQSEKSSTVNNPYDGTMTRKVDYKSIEIPLSVRHYMYLNKNSKLFLEASFVINQKLKSSSINYYINDISMSLVEINTTNNAALGFGYKYNDKYSLELRYQTNREILGNQQIWSSKYQSASIIFGYTIF